MGDRGQIKIKDTGVYLYTHSGATDLHEVLKTALKKKQRWEDSEYLTRIIFCEMIKGYETEEVGFGIGTQRHGDVWRVIEVDCANVTIKEDDKIVSFEEYIK